MNLLYSAYLSRTVGLLFLRNSSTICLCLHFIHTLYKYFFILKYRQEFPLLKVLIITNWSNIFVSFKNIYTNKILSQWKKYYILWSAKKFFESLVLSKFSNISKPFVSKFKLKELLKEGYLFLTHVFMWMLSKCYFPEPFYSHKNPL